MRSRRLMSLSICAAVIFGLWLLATPNSEAIPPNPPIIQLTNSHAIDVRPAWSPDNRLIAFQSNRDSSTFHIYVMNADGSNPRALTRGPADDRHPVWMPDGKSILFDSSDGNQREIWQVSLADGSLKQITHSGAQANFPSPSPDGQRIAFYIYQGNTLDLWTARIDGSQAKKLTNGLASATNNQCTFACHWAAWSPDSRTIAYSAGELDTIWTIGGDGADSNQVIANGQDNHFPWFLPDGRLGYITEHVSPIQSWTDAWAYDLKTGKTTLLQEQMSAQGPFEWSADNTRVLFHSPRSGNFEIYLIDLNAQGGVDALRGTPVPVTLADTTKTASPDPVSKTETANNNGIVWGSVGGVSLLVAVAAIGWVVVRRSKPKGP